jgi:hypothetical protein
LPSFFTKQFQKLDKGDITEGEPSHTLFLELPRQRPHDSVRHLDQTDEIEGGYVAEQRGNGALSWKSELSPGDLCYVQSSPRVDDASRRNLKPVPPILGRDEGMAEDADPTQRAAASLSCSHPRTLCFHGSTLGADRVLSPALHRLLSELARRTVLAPVLRGCGSTRPGSFVILHARMHANRTVGALPGQSRRHRSTVGRFDFHSALLSPTRQRGSITVR